MNSKILIVEDNLHIRENLAELLELDHYTVLSACDGNEGCQMALQQLPDLILCDIQMPVMDGYHMLEYVRKQPSLNHSKFIFFTASAEKKEIEWGMQMGADDYIVKPFSWEDMQAKVNKILS
ncbi:MAG: response regulator [Chitinophagaceae bacterium]|nr:response regulator [Chitinophagaceae bacterium]